MKVKFDFELEKDDALTLDHLLGDLCSHLEMLGKMASSSDDRTYQATKAASLRAIQQLIRSALPAGIA